MHDDESIAENASCMSLDLQSLPSSHAQPILPDENAAKKEEMCKVYQNYNFATKYDNKLPIHKYREEVCFILCLFMHVDYVYVSINTLS